MSAGGHRDVFDADATYVWLGSSDGPLGADDEAVLSPAEQDRARRMVSPADLHYAAAHVAVRRILGGLLDVAPESLRLGRVRCPECAGTDHGAPSIVWPPTELRYSLSRSGPHWLLAVSSGSQLGIDIEERPAFGTEQVAPMVLSASELAHMRQKPDAESRVASFLRCWTRKEAVLKAVGIGLIADVRGVEVRPESDGPVVVRHRAATGPGTWVVEDLPGPPGHGAAIAREAAVAGPLVIGSYPTDFPTGFGRQPVTVVPHAHEQEDQP